MFILISPSKTQDFNKPCQISKGKKAFFLEDSLKLIKVLRKKSKKDLEKIMNISSKLSELNYKRFKKWNLDFKDKIDNEGFCQIKPAIAAFKGDVYKAFKLDEYKKSDFNYAEKNLRIISGLYGLLTPETLLKPYRLEMGIRISFKIDGEEYENLYEFWTEKITKKVKSDFLKSGSKFIVNLASLEYSKVIDFKNFEDGIIANIDFKVKKDNEVRTIAIFAKRQRGEMANWIIKNKIEEISELKKYKNDGFIFSKVLSNLKKNKLVFLKSI